MCMHSCLRARALVCLRECESVCCKHQQHHYKDNHWRAANGRTQAADPQTVRTLRRHQDTWCIQFMSPYMVWMFVSGTARIYWGHVGRPCGCIPYCWWKKYCTGQCCQKQVDVISCCRLVGMVLAGPCTCHSCRT